jgi:hypothetical protein
MGIAAAKHIAADWAMLGCAVDTSLCSAGALLLFILLELQLL